MFKKKNLLWAIFAIVFCFSIFSINLNKGAIGSNSATYAIEVSEIEGYGINDEFVGELTLNNASITESIDVSEDLVINFTGENYITASDCAFNINGFCNLTIKGTGSLVITGETVFGGEDLNENLNIKLENIYAVVGSPYGEAKTSLTVDEISDAKYIKFYSETTHGSDDPSDDDVMPINDEHIHSFAVTSSGATLTAICSADNCTLVDNKVSTTLSVANVKFGENVSPTIDFSDFNTKTNFAVSNDLFTKTYYKTQTAGAVEGGVEISEPVNAGYYYLKLESDKSSIGNQTLVCAFEIQKLDNQITGEDNEISYQEDAFDISQLFNIPENAGTVTYSIIGGNGSATLENNLLSITKCGTILIKATSTGTENYNGSECTKTLTVNKWVLSSLELRINDWFIDSEKPNTPVVKNNYGEGAVTFTYYTDKALSVLTTSENGATENGGVPSKAGIYYVKATIAETDFYQAGECSTGFRIRMYSNADGTSMSIKYDQLVNGTYDVKQMFTFDDTCGAVTYYLFSETEEDTVIPNGILTVSGVGDYKIKVKVEDKGLYAGCGIIVVLTVEKVTLSVKVSFDDWSYGEKPAINNPFIEGNTYRGEVTIEYYTDQNYLNLVDTEDGIPTEVGTYYVKVKIAETDYSHAAEVKTSVKINQKVITINWSENDYTYNGTVQEITATYVNAKNETVSLSVTIDKEFRLFGEYTVTVGFANDESNYALPVETVRVYQMKKIELTVSIDDKKKAYLAVPGAELTAKVTFGKIASSDDLPYSLSTTVTKDSAMGKYEITGTCTNDNYNIHFENGWYSVNNKISNLFIAGWTYGDEPSVPRAETYYGTIVYSYAAYTNTQELTWSSTIPTEPGQYWIKAEVIDENECYSAKDLSIFTIERITVETPAEDKTVYVYNGLTQNYKLAENSSLYKIDGRTQINAGEYRVSISLLDNAHYKWSTSVDKTIYYTFTIHRKSIAKPAKDTRIFKYNGNPITYQIASSTDYNVSDNATQTKVGRYVITISLKDLLNTEWADHSTEDVEYDFVINQNKIDSPTTVDANGNALDSNYVTIVDTDEKGLAPEVKLNVKVLGLNDKNQLKLARNIISSNLKKYDKIFRIYDISLTNGETEIQPDGTISLKMAIPSELKGAKFRLFHIHTDENGNQTVSEVDYGGVDSLGYITFQTSELSEYVFVYEQDSLTWLIATFAIISVLLIALLAVQLVFFFKGKKKKLSKTTLAAAVPVFFVHGEVVASIILGCLLACLIAGNIVLFVLSRKKKQNTKSENKAKAEK